jgi:hypothetical protein
LGSQNKLKRERDEARETIAATLRAWQTAQEKIITVTAHRDEAREVLKMTQEAWVKAKAERVEALRERDEARAESIRWQSIAEGRGRTDDNEQCHTCGSTSTIDNGSACAQCGCDKSLTPNAKP